MDPPSPQPEYTWQTLSAQIIGRIVDFLDIEDIINVSHVCRHYFAVVDERCLWEDLLSTSLNKLNVSVDDLTNHIGSKPTSHGGVAESLADDLDAEFDLDAASGQQQQQQQIAADLSFRIPRKLLFHGSHLRSVSCVHLAQASKLVLVSGSSDSTIKLWDVQSRKCLRTFEGHTERVRSVQFAHYGDADSPQYILSASDDKTIKLWNAKNGKLLATLQEHTDRVTTAQMDAVKIVSGSSDKTIKIWSIKTAKCIHTLRNNFTMEKVSSLRFNDDYLVSGSSNGFIQVWQIEGGSQYKLGASLIGHKNLVSELQLLQQEIGPSNDDNSNNNNNNKKKIRTLLVSGSYDKTVKLWDVETGACLRTFKDHTAKVTSVQFMVLNDHHHNNNITFNPNIAPSDTIIRIISGSEDRTIRIWNADSGKCINTISLGEGEVHCLAFAGTSLVCGTSDRKLSLWDFAGAQLVEGGNKSSTMGNDNDDTSSVISYESTRSYQSISSATSNSSIVSCPDGSKMPRTPRTPLTPRSSHLMSPTGGSLSPGERLYRTGLEKMRRDQQMAEKIKEERERMMRELAVPSVNDYQFSRQRGSFLDEAKRDEQRRLHKRIEVEQRLERWRGTTSPLKAPDEEITEMAKNLKREGSVFDRLYNDAARRRALAGAGDEKDVKGSVTNTSSSRRRL